MGKGSRRVSFVGRLSLSRRNLYQRFCCSIMVLLQVKSLLFQQERSTTEHMKFAKLRFICDGSCLHIEKKKSEEKDLHMLSSFLQ